MSFTELSRQIFNLMNKTDRGDRLYRAGPFNRNWLDYLSDTDLGGDTVQELENYLKGRYRQGYDTLSSQEKYSESSDAVLLKFLEIGCGWSNALRYVARRFSWSEVVGLDISVDNLSRNDERSIFLLQGDAHALPFPDNYFDAVISYAAFPYVVDKLKGLSEIYRVLRKDGMACIGLNPGYFITDKPWLIPRTGESSDVFWSNDRNAIKIIKSGKGLPFAERKFLGGVTRDDEEEWHYYRGGDFFGRSVLSRYDW